MPVIILYGPSYITLLQHPIKEHIDAATNGQEFKDCVLAKLDSEVDEFLDNLELKKLIFKQDVLLSLPDSEVKLDLALTSVDRVLLNDAISIKQAILDPGTGIHPSYYIGQWTQLMSIAQNPHISYVALAANLAHIIAGQINQFYIKSPHFGFGYSQTKITAFKDPIKPLCEIRNELFVNLQALLAFNPRIEDEIDTVSINNELAEINTELISVKAKEAGILSDQTVIGLDKTIAIEHIQKDVTPSLESRKAYLQALLQSRKAT